MIVTVITDASFSQKHKVGTYAFWITSNLGRVQKSGQLRDMMADSSQAEMKCICNALYYIACNAEIMAKATKIIVNTDSMNAIHLFTQDRAAIQKYGLKKKSYKKIFTKYITIRALLAGKSLHYFHVKAHKSTSTPVQYVNDWADKAAKAEMKKRIEKIETRKKQKYDKSNHHHSDNLLHGGSVTAAGKSVAKQGR